MKETLTLEFCEMTVYDRYVVVVVNEGVNITTEYNRTLIQYAETYFSDTPFVYITNRVNSYSVNPQVYIDTAKIKNLKGMAVVSNRYLAKTNAQIEKIFFNKPFEVFTELEDAFAWAEKLINEE